MTLSEFAIEISALRDEAKVLWGYRKGKIINNGVPGGKEIVLNIGYKEHLYLMIESKDPVKYLKDHSGKEA